MLKVEEFGQHGDDFANVAIIRALCDFIGQTYSNARHYQQVLKESIYSKQGQVFSDALYKSLHPIIVQLAEELTLPLTSLSVVIRLENEKTRGHDLRVLSEKLKVLLPPIAFMFQGKGPANELVILLLGYTPRQAENLENQLSKSLQEGRTAGKVIITRKQEFVPQESAL